MKSKIIEEDTHETSWQGWTHWVHVAFWAIDGRLNLNFTDQVSLIQFYLKLLYMDTKKKVLHLNLHKLAAERQIYPTCSLTSSDMSSIS